MKIKNKISLGYVLVSSLILVAVYITTLACQVVRQDYRDISYQTLPVITALEDLRFAGLRIVSSTSEFGFIQAEKKTLNHDIDLENGEGEEENLIQQGKNLFAEKLREYKSLVTSYFPADEENVTAILQAGNSLMQISDMLVQLKKDNIFGEKILELKEKLEKAENNYLSLIDEQITLKRSFIDERNKVINLYLEASLKKILLLTLVIITVSISMSILMSRLIAKPIMQLVDVAKKIGAGDLGVRVSVESKDEIGDLAETVNSMVRDLERTQNDLKKHRDFLEILVAERTKNLKEMNNELQLEIIERKTIQLEMKKTESLLRQAHKMEALGTLAGGIAHDFNNILTPIIGYAEMAKLETPPESSTHEDIHEILKAAKRAKDLIQQILRFSRRSDQKLQPMKIQTIIKESLKLIKATIPASIHINCSIDLECGSVMADPTEIHQVVMNLCTNAYHAMQQDKGGTMSISLAQVHDLPTHLQKKAISLRHYAKLEVRDTGPGMKKEIIDKIFEPYFTTKETGKGTGLGLAVIHGIITSYGGVIEVRSEVGEGTTFQLYFPLLQTTQDISAALINDENYSPPRGDEHILIVDDEEAVLRMEKQMLESLGYTVTARSCSLEALQVFQNERKKFNLVITDMTMPSLTGDELARKIMELEPNMPVILCTGYTEKMNEEQAKKFGIREYIHKPLERNDMAHAIRRVFDLN
ncbi:MAG: ATP-binding protein [Pseudomonadota bacterium]